MKKLFFPLLMILSIIIGFSSCKKKTNEEVTPTGSNPLGVTVPAGFTWEMTRFVHLNVAVNYPDLQQVTCVLRVYNGNPVENGALMVNTKVTNGNSYSGIVNIPSATDQIYLELVKPTGGSEIVALDAADYVTYTFSGVKNTTASVTMSRQYNPGQLKGILDDYSVEYHPGIATWNNLVFEDLWPGYGDYDFNDMVIKYRFALGTVSTGSPTVTYAEYLKATFQVRAVGANLYNGFAFMIDDLDASTVTSGTATNTAVTPTGKFPTDASLKIETGQANVVVPLFDVARSVIDYVEGDHFFNTWGGYPERTSDVIEVTINFTPNTVLATEISSQWPLNPFLVAGANRGVEIHLPGHVYTQKATTSIFGKSWDDTHVGGPKYYQSKENLPWALNIPGNFDYPYEEYNITDTYYHFVEWAQSGNTSYTDWYSNLPGYRDANKIWIP